LIDPLLPMVVGLCNQALLSLDSRLAEMMLSALLLSPVLLLVNL